MQKRDIGIGIIVAILWGLNFIAIKLGVSNMPPFLLATLRFAFVAIPAIFFLPKPPIAWHWIIALGLFLNVGQFAFLFSGVKLGMPAGLSSLVLQAQVFFTLLIAMGVLKEKWKWNHIVGLSIAFIGMAIVGEQQSASMTMSGFWLTLIAAASWGTGNVIMRRATRDVPPFSMLSLIVWAGAVAVIPLGILSYVFEGIDVWKDALSSINGVTVGSLIYLAYFASIMGYVLWGKLLTKYPAGTVAPFSLLVPVVGMSSSFILLHEVLTLYQIFGALLVMAGLLVNVFGEKIKPKKQPCTEEY